MANNSENNWSDNINKTISSWVLLNVLPVLTAIILIAVIITGAVLQPMVIAALKKAGKLQHPTYKLIFHAAIQDILALFLVASPNFITACVGDWPFKEGLCVLEGIFVTTLYIMTFTMIVWMALERCLKLTKLEWWEKLFSNNNGRIYLIIYVVQWILSLIYSVLPLAGVSDIEYQKFGLQCDRTHSDSEWLLHVHFDFTYHIPFLACVVLFAILLFQRVKQAYLEDDDEENLVSTIRSNSSRNELVFSTINENQRTESNDAAAYTMPSTSRQNGHVARSSSYESDQDSDVRPGTSSASDTSVHSSPRRQKRAPLVQRSKSMWDIHTQAEDHRLASTVILTSALIFLFWMPYVTVAYTYTYNNSKIAKWEGFYVIGMIFATASYVIRPITYIIHNEILRTDVKALFPEKAVDKYHHYNEKRKEKMAAIKEKLTVSQKPVDQNSNHVTPVHRQSSQSVRTKTKKKATTSGVDTQSTQVEELEMSQYRERRDVTDAVNDYEDIDSEDPWMSVIEQGSIPGQS